VADSAGAWQSGAMDTALQQVRALLRTRQFRQFTQDPVSDDDLRSLAQVARWSGSSRNSQPWRFLIVRDVEVIRRIADIGNPQTRALHGATAALVITLPHDETHVTSLAYDDGRVAERVLIGASMLGLGAGITWVRADVRQEIGHLLGVPEGRFVRTIMAIGHPSPEALAPRLAPGEARLPLGELVTWREPTRP
jgi:nitroreductase